MPTRVLDGDVVSSLLGSMRKNNFTTLDFIAHMRSRDPGGLAAIEDLYGPGGKGSGNHYSAVSHIAKSLSAYVRECATRQCRPHLAFDRYVQAPSSHGSPVVARWARGGGVDAADDLAADLQAILTDNSTPTEKRRLVDARLGQGKYRDQLIEMWKVCPLTGCADARMLVASHIQRWSECSARERLDPFNGILLSPNADRLFDRGLISFAEDGTLLTSQLVQAKVLNQLSIRRDVKVRFKPDHLPYLAHHRQRWLGRK